MAPKLSQRRRLTTHSLGLALGCALALVTGTACSSDEQTSPASGGAAGAGGSAGAAGSGGGAVQCGDLTGAVISSDTYPDDCAGLSEDESFRCAEQRFWTALREDYAGRPAVYEIYSSLIARLETGGDRKEVANMYFRRGQLAMALAMENADMQKVLTVETDFNKALEFDPLHPVVPTWRDTMRIAIAVVTKDYVAAEALFQEALANVELCPLGNIPSLTGTTIGLPLDTGIPQTTVKLAESWVCEGVEWCEQNTWKAPYAVSGMRYHMGEGFARVGRKEEALKFFRSAQQGPDYDKWPYKDFVDDRIENIDAFIQEFADIGEHEPVFDRVYANSDFGCKFCHGVK